MSTVLRQPRPHPRADAAVTALDVAVGAADLAWSALDTVGHRVGSIVRPALVVARTPGVGGRPPPAWVGALARRGSRRRKLLLDELAAAADTAVPWATAQLVRRVDLTDLTGLAEQVIAAVDLPEIIRESTGAVTSETVRGVRMRSISGDEMLQRAVDRVRLRRGEPPQDRAGPP